MLIRKYFILIVEGALYGFFGGALLWISLYLIYETDISIARSQKLDKISIDFAGFPLKFLGFCLSFMILASLVRLIIGFFFQKYNHLLLSWLLTGVISIVVVNLILSDAPSLIPTSVGYGLLCCLDNSSGYLLWVITFSLIVLYTFLFVSVKKFILRRQKLAGSK